MEKQKIAVEWIDEKRGPHRLTDAGFEADRTKKYNNNHPPVVVIEYEDSYGIVDGRHRIMAAKNNEVKKIKAHVIEPQNWNGKIGEDFEISEYK